MYIMLSRKDYKTIKIIEDEEEHWEIGERSKQESGSTKDEPLFVHIGFSDNNIIAIHDKEYSMPPIGIIGMGESSKKELVEILQTITTEEGYRAIIIVGDHLPTPLERKHATLGDFAHMLIEETREEIFMITNTLDRIENIELKIEEHNKFNQKQAQRYHPFHNQKPRGPQGQYARRGRK